jgi:UV DNA damage endonuclease
VIESSLADLDRHVKMFELMELDEKAKMVMHVGAGNKNKEESMQRFETEWENVPHRVRNRLTLENDDKTFTAGETLGLCERLDIPMVLDIHHHRCLPGDDDLRELTPRIFKLWEGTGLVPKIHVSSPKNEKDIRHHADYIDPHDLVPFLEMVRELGDQDLDIMIEAKEKDDSVMRLADDLEKMDGFKRVDGATFLFRT